jgi:hypothetical protein
MDSLSNIQVHMTEFKQSPLDASVVLYTMEIVYRSSRWALEKRYSEFDELQKNLKKLFHGVPSVQCLPAAGQKLFQTQGISLTREPEERALRVHAGNGAAQGYNQLRIPPQLRATRPTRPRRRPEPTDLLGPILDRVPIEGHPGRPGPRLRPRVRVPLHGQLRHVDSEQAERRAVQQQKTMVQGRRSRQLRSGRQA